jgi:hypothetical protein
MCGAVSAEPAQCRQSYLRKVAMYTSQTIGSDSESPVARGTHTWQLTVWSRMFKRMNYSEGGCARTNAWDAVRKVCRERIVVG